jgi:16S rRNA (guanine527-N7)-methyltransferase
VHVLPDFEIYALQDGANSLNVALSAVQMQQFALYSQLLLKWNAVHNLTAIVSPEEVIAHHLLDSLAIVTPLRRISAMGTRLLDVGSGGGLPGIPLAITCPDLAITLLDAAQKKCAFLTQVRVELQLANVEVVRARVEQWHARRFDAVVTRAFASLRDFVVLTAHLLSPEGAWLAMKGPGGVAELADLPATVASAEVVPLVVPGLQETRNLVILRPQRDVGQT